MPKTTTCASNRDESLDLQDAEIRESLSHIKNKILVMSGKGGVGKSSTAAYLSIALAKKGYRVGLMDVDLHGPSIPRMLGIKGGVQPSSNQNKILPVDAMPGLGVISIEVLTGDDKDVATIWRGPLKIGVIKQFIADIEWADLDYLIIDSPPGTGDEPLTVAQSIPDAKAVIVTTPQEISLADVRKSINFCRKVNMEILGLVENMCGFKCPHCNQDIDLFKTEGGKNTAEKEGLRLLGSLPIEPEMVRKGDTGELVELYESELPFALEFKHILKAIEESSNKDTDTDKEGSQTDVSKGLDSDKVVIAVPTAEGKLCSHFGHCDQFALIETVNGKICGQTMQTPPPHEPGVLPKWLHEQGASLIIAGGMGSKAQELFGENGIKVITGAPMDAPESLVNQYFSSTLMTGSNACDH